MRLADRERRRLDAEAFDYLENEDGFRLQLLLEFRNRAARSRRLLIDELLNAHLINKKRHQTLASRLGIDQAMLESLAGDQTLGEESYEDSIVDVAPLPRSLNAPVSASITERPTLAHGSKLNLDHGHLLSSDHNLGSKSGDEHLSDGEMSSISMHAKAPTQTQQTALLGAPAQQRLTEPDPRDPELTPSLKDRTPKRLSLLPLIAQTEKLLQAIPEHTPSALRLSIAARSFGRLCHELSSQSASPDVSSRMQKLCVLILQTLEPAQAQAWLNAFMVSTLNQLDATGEVLNSADTCGTLSIQCDAVVEQLKIDRVVVKDGWNSRNSVTIPPLNTVEQKDEFTPLRQSYPLSEGWYEVTWLDGDKTRVAQRYVIKDTETTLTLPKHDATTQDLTLISSGIALLGAELESPKHLDFGLYEVPSYLLSQKPVSFREYFVFLKFLSETQGKQAALRRSPRSATRGEFRWSDLDFSKPDECTKQLGALYDNAITGISFHDARAYCHWLNIEKGPGHRLPNEIEWEKAIRGCLGTRWSWGDVWSATLSQAPSPFGIKLSSAVRLEWTSSSGQDARYRIARGIGLENETPIEGLSERLFLPEEQVNQHVGFRVAKTCT